MKIVLLSGVPIRSDVEAAPVGIYDVIREDVRQISTVKPVDRIFIERSKMGYRGVLYSSDEHLRESHRRCRQVQPPRQSELEHH